MRNFRNFIIGGLLAAGCVWAGTGNLPQIVTAVVQKAHINDIRTALYQDILPRDGSGTTTSLGGSLGTGTYQWLKARIASGYWSLGDIKVHHSYNGAAPIDEGWMLMDGRQITQANYDTEHGSGHWATYVGSSSLLNKYLPNMTGKYTVGSATTTQSGSSPITFTGNASNQINLAHTHSVYSHPIYLHQNGTTDDLVFDHDIGPVNDSSNVKSLQRGTAKNSLSLLVGNTSSLAGTFGANIFNPPMSNGADYDLATGGLATNGTGSTLSSTQSIQPESLQVLYYMRIID